MKKLIKIENVGGELKVDSRLIAEKLGVENRATVKTIKVYKTNLEKYGEVTFQMLPSYKTDSYQKEEMCFLNEKQSTFLVTLSKNSEQAVELKQQLTDSYFYYKEQQNPKELSRLEILEIALKSEKENLKLKSELKGAQPKIEFHDQVGDSKGLYSIGEVAKMLNLDYGRNKMFETLRSLDIFFNCEPYQKYINQGYFEVKSVTKNGYIKKQAFATAKGFQWLQKKYFQKPVQTEF